MTPLTQDVEYVSTAALFRATGVTRRQVDTWSTMGAILPVNVRPEMLRAKYRWPPCDVVRVRALVHLAEALGKERSRRKSGPWWEAAMALAGCPDAELAGWLVVTEERAMVCSSSATVAGFVRRVPWAHVVAL